MEISGQILLILFLVAVAAAWVDVIAGGGGLLTIPMLILFGMPPAMAMATNKLQGSVGTLTASIFFIRKGTVNLLEIRLLMLMTFLGSLAGAWLILKMDPEKLVVYIPVLLILMGLYFLFSPHISDEDRRQKLSLVAFALLICPFLGFYDGFFGPGTGSFMALSFVLLCGFNIGKATAHAKILNFTSNFSSLLYFIAFGEIHWLAGTVMMLGQLIGATFAARTVLSHGSRIIKPVVVTVCFAMSLNILLRNYG